MTTLDKILGKGERNAMTRTELRIYLGVTDRRLRGIVEEQRAAGVPILSTSDGSGYYLPDDGEQGQQEARRCLMERWHRIDNIRRANYGIERYLADS